MKKMAEGIAESMGGSCDFHIRKGYPFLINEEKLSEQVVQYASAYMGEDHVVEQEIWMAAEDFAYYSQATNACFYTLGVGNREKGISSSLHNPTFNIDENALKISSGLMAYLAVKLLGN
jgi:amidohydrolase